MTHFLDYLYVSIFALVGTGFVSIILFTARILRPHPKKSLEKLSPYECGMIPFGERWSQFNIQFYIFALLFLVFDVEIAFLYPWAVVFKELGIAIFLEMMLFIAILVLGLIYAWKKGVLKWM